MACGLVFVHVGYSGGGAVADHRWAAEGVGGDRELAVVALSGGAAGAGSAGGRGRGGERGGRAPVRGAREYGAGVAQVVRAAWCGRGGGGRRGAGSQALVARGDGR